MRRNGRAGGRVGPRLFLCTSFTFQVRAVGFEPLPFDPIGPCLCHKNCPDFRKVSARYWVNVDTGGEVPRLDEGILAEIDPGSAGQSICIWTAFPPVTFPQFFQLTKQPRVLSPSEGTRWTMVFNGFFPFLDYLAFDVDFEDVCNFDTVILPKSSGEASWSDCTLVRVDWWKNANDVPH